ncbi:uncharacterized protein ACLA_087490 [Aspergillus clavatus NRRL 1]|uniref:Uncharacterized protein n=1 Tax=Aspergillus clavatus (strain ATCC 1007 / CBS 513.65 / DSM 816 / NCTC 3887 / NRRL 1 / QM 1276 / 107) TaxID=344612 RepID=A1CUQ6_ASPCL|nr:uncharacterized protein ACLA_087490 [Aspergillus clavatus NRRL 1]EAW07043.1 hypothetical protein ACLA_087490 [Aspergillus clavatus NRRL 1]
MKFTLPVIAGLATLAIALPQDVRSPQDTVVYFDENHQYAPNGTHGFIEIDGVMTALDLTTPDVIHEEHIIRKPLGPDSSFNVSIGLAQGGGDLDKRADGHCSMFFGCKNEYILVKGNLWSYWTTRYGSGYALNGPSASETIDADSTTLIRSFGGLAFSHNTKKAGCHIRFELRSCRIDVPTERGQNNELSVDGSIN